VLFSLGLLSSFLSGLSGSIRRRVKLGSGSTLLHAVLGSLDLGWLCCAGLSGSTLLRTVLVSLGSTLECYVLWWALLDLRCYVLGWAL
jgi:hypothetical protein